MIDEHEWRSVAQVAKDGTFSAAARHLFVSQPSLSQCIKKLEDELGVQLFDRSQTPIVLTEEGRIYLEEAKKIEAVQRDLERRLADLTDLRTGSLTIGSSRTRSNYYLQKPLIEFHRRYPGIRLHVIEESVKELREAVQTGKADFALLYEPLDTKLFETIPLCDEHTLAAVPMNHPLAAAYEGKQVYPFPFISFTQFDGEPFIKLKKGRIMEPVFQELCAMTGCEPQVVFEASSIVQAAMLCANGMGITLVTDMLTENPEWVNRPFFFRLQEPLPARRLIAAYRRNAHISRAARAFLSVLRETSNR